jgi:hypothetical protein
MVLGRSTAPFLPSAAWQLRWEVRPSVVTSLHVSTDYGKETVGRVELMRFPGGSELRKAHSL